MNVNVYSKNKKATYLTLQNMFTVTYAVFNAFELNAGVFSQPQYILFAGLLPAKSYSSVDKNNQSETT